MNDEKDPQLEALFATAPRATPSDVFVAGVMQRIDRQRRRMVYGWILAGLVLLPIAWWMATPIASAVELAARLMPESLISIESDLFSQLLAPINSVTGVLGLVFLLVWWLLRLARS